MHKQGGKIVLWGIIIGMLAYTAIRTIHFLQLTLPADQQYVAYIGLIAFDVGVLAWFYYAISAAEGATQRAIAYGMIFVCATGVCTTTVMDMTLGASRNGLYAVPPQWFTVGLWAVILVIITNFIAGICVHLNDPEQKKRMEIQQICSTDASTSSRSDCRFNVHATNTIPHPAARTAKRLAGAIRRRHYRQAGAIADVYRALYPGLYPSWWRLE